MARLASRIVDSSGSPPTAGAALDALLSGPAAQPGAATLEAIDAGPMPEADALARSDLDRLLDPAPLTRETGWCRLPDGCGYVAVRTAMPGVSGEMVDWWFDWHPRDARRYRAWHPAAHRDNALDPPARPGAKAHWGAVHHPVEDIGIGTVHARIAFLAPSAAGFSGDALDEPRVATIVCGRVGDDRRRVWHTLMAHVFLRDGDGIVLRSHFWLGAGIRPFGPAPLGTAGAALLNRPAVRRRAIPAAAPRALARHCAEEYANLAAFLPGLHAREWDRA